MRQKAAEHGVAVLVGCHFSPNLNPNPNPNPETETET